MRAPASLNFVSGGYLGILNGRVARGRTLAPTDDVAGAPPVAVVSHGLWVARLGADPSIVGRPIWLNGTPFTVVGVAERGFTGTTDTPPAVWAPIAGYHVALGGPPVDRTSSARVHIVGRIAGGVAPAQAAMRSSARSRRRLAPRRATVAATLSPVCISRPRPAA